MSLTYRLTAGLPALGVSVLAAAAFGGAPASAAAADVAAHPALPSVTAGPCYDGDSRTKCNGGADGYGNTGNGNGTGTGNGNGTGTGNGNGAKPTDNRGKPGYGGTSPTTAPPTTPTTAPTPVPTPTGTTPTGITDTVPPGGVSPTSVAPYGTTPVHGRGVSAGAVLPVTGPPMGPTIGSGALLLAFGGAAVWYTRRRRSA